MKQISTFFLLFFVFIYGALAQSDNEKGQFYKHLPLDLNKETLIFLRHDSVDVPSKKPKGMTAAEFNRLWNHNNVIPTSNKQLKDGLKEYPFKYIISSFDKLDSLSKVGYKYVYWFPGLEKVKTGTRMGTRVSTKSTPNGLTNTYYYSTQYIVIKDLQNNDRYYVDNFSETFIYYYKGIVGMLMKKVKKQLKEESKRV